VGSSVGGIIILGGIALVVGAIAYKLTRGGDKYDGNNSGPRKSNSNPASADVEIQQTRPGRSRTLWQVLTRQQAVDVFNPETKMDHQSITARAPAYN
jgi:hypothetical protein